MADGGFDLVEHRVKQVTNSFTESRNLLAEIEDSLHASGQLRKGESDKIAEVDSELLRYCSSIQGGWERITRFKGKAVIASDDQILFVLDKAFDGVEDRLYRVLLDALTNEGFLDYGSLITAGAQESKPLVDALKDLANRLRGIQSPSNLTPPTSASDRPGSRSNSRGRGLKAVRDPRAALGLSRQDQTAPSAAFYNQARKAASLTSSNHSGSGYESDSYRTELELLDTQRARDHESFSSRSIPSHSRNAQSSWSNAADFETNTKHRPPPLFSNRPRNDGSRPRVVSSVQEELPDLDMGSISLSPDSIPLRQPFDSRNNSTSDDGGHHSHIYGSSWKSSSIPTPDTIPSPVSPGPPPYTHNDGAYRSNVGKVREAPMIQHSRETRTNRTKKHESVEAVSPHSQPRRKHIDQQIDSFGPPPAPPPAGRLPEPPRPPKVSLFPAASRRDIGRDIGSVSSNGSVRSSDSGYAQRSQVTAIPIQAPPRQQNYGGTPPDRAFPPLQMIGTHGLSYTSPPTSAPLTRVNERQPVFTSSHEMPFRPVQQGLPQPPPPPAKAAAPVKPVTAYPLDDEETIPNAPPVKQILPPKEPQPTLGSNLNYQASRTSLAQTTSSEGTITQEKWICLTRTVKQIPGLASPPIELVPSTSSSTRPADNLPNESNKFWTLCKNAVAMQNGDKKKSAEEVATRPTGITGNEKYMKCRKCKYEYGAYAKNLAGKGATTDPRWKDGPGGIRYKETLLFKSHVSTKKDKLPQEDYHFGCIFCAATGNGMPIYKGKTSFLTHIAEHGNGVYPNEVLKTRIKFTTKREFDPNDQDEYHELILP